MKWRRFNGQRIETPIKEAVEETIVKEMNLGE